MLRILIPALTIFLMPTAQAHDEETLFNKVSLQAEAQREVPNDEMTVVVTAEAQGPDPSALAERVNKDMAWALDLAKKQPAIEAETRGYSTSPIYGKASSSGSRMITGWHVRQQLQLKTTEFQELTELLGTLQERLQLTQMGFSPTPATRQKHQNELISEAMQAFKERVAIIRENMDGRDYRIIELNVNTSGFGYRPMVMADMAVSKMERSAPAVEGGTSEVTVTVSGSVQFY